MRLDRGDGLMQRQPVGSRVQLAILVQEVSIIGQRERRHAESASGQGLECPLGQHLVELVVDIRMARDFARAVGKQQRLYCTLLLIRLLIVGIEAFASDLFHQRIVSPLRPGLLQCPDFANRLREDFLQQRFLGSMFDERVAGSEFQRAGDLANAQRHAGAQPDSARGNVHLLGKRLDRRRWKHDIGAEMVSRRIVHHLECTLGLQRIVHCQPELVEPSGWQGKFVEECLPNPAAAIVRAQLEIGDEEDRAAGLLHHRLECRGQDPEVRQGSFWPCVHPLAYCVFVLLFDAIEEPILRRAGGSNDGIGGALILECHHGSSNFGLLKGFQHSFADLDPASLDAGIESVQQGVVQERLAAGVRCALAEHTVFVQIHFQNPVLHVRRSFAGWVSCEQPAIQSSGAFATCAAVWPVHRPGAEARGSGQSSWFGPRSCSGKPTVQLESRSSLCKPSA